MTFKAFENAITIVMVLGGSTNAVLHLIAMAKSVGLKITQEDFQRISDKTPLIADLKPSGKYLMEALHKIGGVPSVIKYLLSKGYMHGDCLTVTGKTLAENVASAKDLDFEKQDVILPLEKPLKKPATCRFFTEILHHKDQLPKSPARKANALKEPHGYLMASLNWWTELKPEE